MKKNTYHPDRIIGVWMDYKHAYLVKLTDQALVEELKSEEHIKDENNITRLNNVPFSQADKQNHERLNQQKFLKKIINRLKEEEYAYIFGPGEAKHGLINLIEKEGRHFPCKVVGLESADKLTPNQLIQKVKDFFISLKFEDIKRRLNLGIKENA
jgi:stalled ribosome rescue protein Dom34